MNHLFEILELSASSYSKQRFVQMKKEGQYYGYSFQELYERAKKIGSWLITQGINPGDRVAVLSEGCPEWSIAFFAIQVISATAVPMDVKLKETEWRFILENSGAKAICLSKKFSKVISHLPESVIPIHLEEIEELADSRGQLPALDASFPALIVYTSGTTGNPKGVMISHKNIISDIEMVDERVEGLFANKHFLSILPLNHLLELTGGFLAPLWGGSTITYAESLKGSIVLERMRETKPHIMLVVPAFLTLLRREIERKAAAFSQLSRIAFKSLFAFSGLLDRIGVSSGRVLFKTLHAYFGGNMRYFLCGGAPLDLEAARCFEAIGFIVLEGYGLTETSPIVSVNSPKERKLGSVGRPLKGVSVKIETPNEEGEGEILIKGPNVMLGYFGNKEATDEVLKDGWFYTGDLGRIDSNGYLFITGRKKNLIVTAAGKKISPEEVEDQLLKSPYIKEVCVVGKPVGTNDEDVYALIIPDLDRVSQEGETANMDLLLKSEIKKVCEGLAGYKRVKDFIIWEGEFPKTTTLKLRRNEIRRIFLEQSLTVSRHVG